MTNNDIFKKLRVALQLRDDQIVAILELVDFRMSKGELGNIFRKEDHKEYVECGDQLLRNFLNGLVIHLRGTKENPKNPAEVIKSHTAGYTPNPDFVDSKGKPKDFKLDPTKPREYRVKPDKPKFDKPNDGKFSGKSKPDFKKGDKKPDSKAKKDFKPKPVVENFKYTSGKDSNKKKDK